MKVKGGPETLEAQLRSLHEHDIDYAEKWVKESVFWILNRVYQQIGSIIARDLPDDGLHIDLLSGTGSLCLSLGRQVKDASIVGIDRNPHMLPNARILNAELATLTGIQTDLQIFHREIASLDESGNIQTTHLPPEEDQVANTEWLEQGWAIGPSHGLEIKVTGLHEHGDYPYRAPNLDQAGVTLISDNVTNLRLTKHFLGERQADTVSIMFPGESNRVVEEAGGPTRDRGKIISVEVHQALIKAVEFATQILKPGGKLTFVRRLPAHALKTDDQKRSVLSFSLESVRAHMDKFEKSFGAGVLPGVFKNPNDGNIVWWANGKAVDEVQIAYQTYTLR